MCVCVRKIKNSKPGRGGGGSVRERERENTSKETQEQRQKTELRKEEPVFISLETITHEYAETCGCGLEMRSLFLLADWLSSCGPVCKHTLLLCLRRTFVAPFVSIKDQSGVWPAGTESGLFRSRSVAPCLTVRRDARVLDSICSALCAPSTPATV